MIISMIYHRCTRSSKSQGVKCMYGPTLINFKTFISDTFLRGPTTLVIVSTVLFCIWKISEQWGIFREPVTSMCCPLQMPQHKIMWTCTDSYITDTEWHQSNQVKQWKIFNLGKITEVFDAVKNMRNYQSSRIGDHPYSKKQERLYKPQTHNFS